MRSLKTFDYNKPELAYFADALRGLRLDVICLQESECTDQDSIAKDLAAMLGMEHVFETPMHPSHIDAKRSLSLAMLSKLPLKNTRTAKQPYPSFDLWLPNGAPAKRTVKDVQTAETQDGLHIANTQTQPLEYLGTPYESQRGQSYAAELADMFIKTVSQPLIFAGDFSTSHPAKVFASLCKAHALSDALPFEPTKPHGKGHLDCIFTSPTFTITSSAVVTTETDHFLGWVELQYDNDKEKP